MAVYRHPDLVWILGTDVVIDKGTQQADHTMRNTLGSLCEIMQFSYIRIRRDIEPPARFFKEPFYTHPAQVFRMKTGLPNLTGANHAGLPN